MFGKGGGESQECTLRNQVCLSAPKVSRTITLKNNILIHFLLDQEMYRDALSGKPKKGYE